MRCSAIQLLSRGLTEYNSRGNAQSTGNRDDAMEVDQVYSKGFKGKNGGKNGSKYKSKVFKGKGKDKGHKDQGKENKKKFDGECHNCGKYGHMMRDCWHAKNGKASGKDSRVTEVTEEIQTKRIAVDEEIFKQDSWIFAMGKDRHFESSMILVDSGSDEHVCSYSFAPLAKTRETTNRCTMRDAQGNQITHEHQRDVKVRMQTSEGLTTALTTFEVADVKGAILSVGKLVQRGFQVTLAPGGSFLEKNGKKVELIMKKNSFYLPAMVCAVETVEKETSKGSNESKPDVTMQGEIHADTKPVAAASVDDPPVPKSIGGLSAWSAVKDLQSRLKQLGAPYYGEKRALWKRLQEYEHRAKAELAYQAELEAAATERREAQGEHPARMLSVPKAPSAEERVLHELTHIPARPWCEQCIRGKAAMTPHRAKLPQEREKGIPVIAIDFMYLKADCTSCDDMGTLGRQL